MSQRSFMQTHPCATWARGIVRKAGKYYERAVAAAAATFLAALAAFAAVDALRRLLVFGGVAGGLAAPLGLRRRGRGFADQFRRHHAGDEQLWPVIIKINRGTLLVRGSHDSQAVHIVFDCLSFLHCLHIVLLDHSTRIKLFWWVPRLGSQSTLIYRLEAGDVLRLKALGTLFHFKLYRLTLVPVPCSFDTAADLELELLCFSWSGPGLPSAGTSSARKKRPQSLSLQPPERVKR